MSGETTSSYSSSKLRMCASLGHRDRMHVKLQLCREGMLQEADPYLAALPRRCCSSRVCWPPLRADLAATPALRI